MGEEKKFALAKEVSEIEHDGVISNDQEVIQRAFFEHYRSLFEADGISGGETSLEDLLRNLPVLSEEVKKQMEEPITEDEIGRAIDGLPDHKTPGPDGICAEFYKN